MKRIQCETCSVRGRGMICDVPADALDHFRSAGAIAVYKPRQIVFNEGTPANGLYLLCHGLVKVYHSDPSGRDHILEVAGPGAVLGELPLNGDRGLSVSAEALSESQLCFLPRERLVPFLEKYPATGVRLVAALSGALASARRQIRDLTLRDAESRLAGLLLQFGQATGEVASGTQLQLRYTRQQLGEMIGVTTETAIRLLTRLRKKRLIRIDRRAIVIADVRTLSRIANNDDAAM